MLLFSDQHQYKAQLCAYQCLVQNIEIHNYISQVLMKYFKTTE